MTLRLFAALIAIGGIGFAPASAADGWKYQVIPNDGHELTYSEGDITRDTQKSIAFGAGPHYCAGALASRAMVADVALPGIFARLAGLRLDQRAPVRIGGWAFRGLLNLPVQWDAN
jgi:hypothetical protein